MKLKRRLVDLLMALPVPHLNIRPCFLQPDLRRRNQRRIASIIDSSFEMEGRYIKIRPLVGVERKGDTEDSFRIEEYLKELSQLAYTAGLMVVGSTYQKLTSPNPRTYIGSGKVAEIRSAIHALDVETVIFDDELSPGQLRNLEKNFGGDVRVCDRIALIPDIFNQRAARHEASLQVALAQMEYQLPQLTKMWTHLEQQVGGKMKGMGEEQIEVDKIGVLKKELESVRKHRNQYRTRRVSVPVPVVSLVFVQMKNGNEFLLTDTIDFIQKLPTTLVKPFIA